MSFGIPMFFVYKSTFKPTGGVYFGIHQTSDMNFGTPESHDPFVGSGPKIKDLVQRGARRSHFNVEKLYIGTMEQCQDWLNRNIQVNYDHPQCLNSKPGAPAGVPKTEEHKAAISEALETAMEGNTNALGTIQPPRIQHGGKLKWFHSTDAQLMLETVDGKTPVDSSYASWSLGQLPKTTAKAPTNTLAR